MLDNALQGSLQQQLQAKLRKLYREKDSVNATRVDPLMRQTPGCTTLISVITKQPQNCFDRPLLTLF